MTEGAKPQNEHLSDLKRLQKQWHKLSGLHTREEWSAAMVRAATAAELAANYAIRREFDSKSQFRADFITSLLRWANGLDGKINKLLIPVNWKDDAKALSIGELKKLASEINQKRNAIVHQSEFCNEIEATAIIGKTREFIVSLIRLYDSQFELKERDK